MSITTPAERDAVRAAGALAVQVEHTVLVTEDGMEILTVAKGR